MSGKTSVGGLGVVYQKVQTKFNELMNATNVANTAPQFLVRYNSTFPYTMGSWGPTLVPNDPDWGSKPAKDRWQTACDGIPPYIRYAVEAVITKSMQQRPPMPIEFQISENPALIEHELTLKRLNKSGVEYIGISIVCPPTPPPKSKGKWVS